MEKISKNFGLLCNVCGNDQFVIFDKDIENMVDAPDYTKIKCSDCGKIFTKEQLLKDNAGLVDANISDIEKEVLDKAVKEIKEFFK